MDISTIKVYFPHDKVVYPYEEDAKKKCSAPICEMKGSCLLSMLGNKMYCIVTNAIP